MIIFNLNTLIWFQLFRSNTSNFYTVLSINHHYHHVTLVARISLTLSRHSSLSFIALGRSSGQHPVSSHRCCSCWSSCFCTAICGCPSEYISYEFVSASPAVSCMSGSSNLNSFRDRRQVAVQLVCCHQDFFKIARSILV